MDQVFDITIIGGGPVGLFAAFYAGLRQAKVKIIEKLPNLGGQPAHLYAEKKIYDIPAYPEIRGEELTERLVTQLSRFDIQMALGEEALAINELEDEDIGSYFAIESDKAMHYSKTIIIAAGNGAFTPRKINLDQAENYEDTNLNYYVLNLDKFQDQRVAICGGGDSAVDLALTLESIAKEVYLIHRRKQFRALESSVKQLEESSVHIMTPYKLTQLVGEDNRISSLRLTKDSDEDSINLPIDQLIVNYGFSSSLKKIRDWGFTIERNAIKVDNQYETSIPGIYAIGDIAHYDGKVKIIASGFGEAPQAVNNAIHFIDPTQSSAPVHSTDLIKE